MLAIAFRIVGDYRLRSSRNRAQWEDPESFRARRFDLDTIGGRDLLCGHFDVPGCRLWERYPEAADREVRRIAFLRDPLDRAVSEYFFARKTGVMDLRGETLDAHLEATADPVARYLAPDPADAPQALAGYWHVGTVETLDRDIAALLGRVGAGPGIPARVNATPRPQFDLPNDVVDRFRARNAIDYALHAMAVRRSSGSDLDSVEGVA
jgi:hypothetical protein